MKVDRFETILLMASWGRSDALALSVTAADNGVEMEH